MSTTIHVGNALDVLAGLPSESVHCCVTSPPYWGLRSYNGDTWEGGDPSCDHARPKSAASTRRGRDSTDNHAVEGWPCGTCGKCGAHLTGSMIGLEPTFDEHLSNLVAVFREVRRVLRSDGTLWLNYGDAYVAGQGGRQSAVGEMPKKVIQKRATPRKRDDVDVGSWSNRDATDKMTAPSDIWKPKDLMMMPARVAMALQADGWWLRSEIVWHKPNPMPESCTDRPTSSHEKLFLLTKSARYFYDADAVRTAFSGETKDLSFDTMDFGRRDKYAGESVEGGRRGRRLEKMTGQYAKPYDPVDGKDFADTGAQDARSVKSRIVDAVRSGAVTGANMRNVLTIPTHSFPGAHFATFPPALVEPCIKAGTSERGVCVECGAPWKRQIKKELVSSVGGWNQNYSGTDRTRMSEGQDAGSNRARDGHVPGGLNKNTTTGWAPPCEHYDELYRERDQGQQPKSARKRQQRAAWPDRGRRVRARPGSDKWETVQATVCDPFCGSGTVGLVADRLQRDSILIELSPEYAEMAGRRIKADAPLFANVVGV